MLFKFIRLLARHSNMLVLFFCYFLSMYLIIFHVIDMVFTIAAALEDDDEDAFFDIINGFGFYIRDIREVFDLNYSERHRNREIFLREIVDNFNNNFVFPIYNYFYPSNNPAYNLFFESNWGIIVGGLEFAFEDIGADVLYVAGLIMKLLDYIQGIER